MTVQTKQTLAIDNMATVKDDNIEVSELKLEKLTVNIQEYLRWKETIAPLATYIVDFGGVVPTYLKLQTKGELEMAIDTGNAILWLTQFEISADPMPAITLYNPDTTKSVDVDFLLAM